MNLFNSILIDTILVVSPFCLYFLYLIYVKTLELEKKNLFLDLSLISSYYLLFKLGIDNNVVLVLVNLPLIIAFYNHRKWSIIILSLLSIYYYYNLFGYIVLFIFEYIVYYILYILFKDKYIELFINIIITIKLIIIITINYNLILLMILLIILVKFIIFLFKKMNQIIEMHSTFKQIENDQKMYESLFKITHEIKNPISVIKGYLDMFDVNNQSHAIKYIPIIKSETERILVLLEDFLSINRIKIKKEIIDISFLIEEVIKNFNLIIKNKKININFDQDEIFIEGDYNRLKQVIINIIKNSIEAIEENGNIDININIIKNKIYIEIKDDGIGMSKEEINKLNYPFYTTKRNGTGLGVYLSIEIIKKHNGEMIYSSLNGVKVTIKLPYDASLN